MTLDSPLTFLAGLSLAIWMYLFFFRGGFWRADQRLTESAAAPDSWPPVAVIVPARNEADVVARSLRALLGQDYPGTFAVILVDDHSDDGTAAQAQSAAEDPVRLTVIPARDLPPGWSGKLWALSEGIAQATTQMPDAGYLWFSDADIEHDPGNLRALVARAETRNLDLVSLMAFLSCKGFWERLLIPPFIYFFQMLYPFAWSNDPAKATAAAAGGCVLLRREALQSAGGIAAIRGALIDDCSLARLIKERPGSGGIWLGLTRAARSLRPYSGLGEIWAMVSRSAYTQLRYSPLLLLGTLIGMILTYLVPPALTLLVFWTGNLPSGLLAGGAWLIMTLTFRPTLAFYGQPLWQAPLLPLSAALYAAMTFDSARQHWRGRGGHWKGRTQAALEERAGDR